MEIGPEQPFIFEPIEPEQDEPVVEPAMPVEEPIPA